MASMWLKKAIDAVMNVRIYVSRQHVALQQEFSNHASHLPSNGNVSSSYSVRRLLRSQIIGRPSLQPHRRSFVSVAASSKQLTDANLAKLPDSRDEAIAQACQAISSQLIASRKHGKRKKAGAEPTGGLRLSIEIPVVDDSESAAIKLATEVLSGLPSANQRSITILSAFCPGTDTSAGRLLPSLPSRSVIHRPLESSSTDDEDVCSADVLVILAPGIQHVPLLERLLRSWRGTVAIVLNPIWGAASVLLREEEEEADAAIALIRSFDTVYCFMPIQVKAFVVNTYEGAVFRQVLQPSHGVGPTKAAAQQRGFAGGGKGSEITKESTSKGAADQGIAPWWVFLRNGERWVPIARMQRRPMPDDLEAAFYNASAASSPLAVGAKLLRSLTQRGDQQR